MPASNEAQGLLDIAEELAHAVMLETRPQPPTIELAGGLAGEALFFAHLARHRDPNGAFTRTALERLDTLVNQLRSADSIVPGLFTGLAGVAWSMRHVADLLDIDDLKSPAVYQQLYEFVAEYLSPAVEFEYDLIGGLAGIGLWALTIEDPAWQSRILNRVLALLSASAEHVQHGIAWRTPLARIRRVIWRQIDPWELDLGVAHGSAGVIGFLAACVQQRVRMDASSEMLEASVAWLRKQALTAKEPSVFPTTTRSPEPARLAWCYGDAGIAVVLHRAARALRSADLTQFADQVTHSVSRRRVQDSFAIDAGLCHGRAGLAHLCTLLARYSRSSEIELARTYWLDALLACRRTDIGAGGFPHWSGAERRLVPRTDLLTGASGVGLALLAQACGDVSWAYPFLAN